MSSFFYDFIFNRKNSVLYLTVDFISALESVGVLLIHDVSDLQLEYLNKDYRNVLIQGRRIFPNTAIIYDQLL